MQCDTSMPNNTGNSSFLLHARGSKLALTQDEQEVIKERGKIYAGTGGNPTILPTWTDSGGGDFETVTDW